MASSSPPTRNEGGLRRELEIYRAAIEIFHRRGFADTSVEDIAEAVGILKGSLYHYIDSKEDLLFRILAEVHEEVEALLRAALDQPDVSAFERLLDYVRGQATYNTQNIEKIAVYYHDLNQLSPQRQEDIAGKRRAHERSVKQLIQTAQEEGDVAEDLDPSLATAEVFALVGWLYTWFSPKGPVPGEQVADFTVEFARRALSPVIAIPSG